MPKYLDFYFYFCDGTYHFDIWNYSHQNKKMNRRNNSLFREELSEVTTSWFDLGYMFNGISNPYKYRNLIDL